MLEKSTIQDFFSRLGLKPYKYSSGGNHDCFTLTCHSQTYQKLLTEPTKIGHIFRKIKYVH
jgi:hypothetical protein